MLLLRPIDANTPRNGRIALARVIDTERHPLLPRIAWLKAGRWAPDEHQVMAWREDAQGAPGPKTPPRLDPTHWATLEEIEVAS